jgi:hypothetical protein
MQTKLQVSIKFPTDVDTDDGYHKLWKYLGSAEHIEQAFEIELSCGDGLFMSDFYTWSENKESLICQVTDEDLLKYDGNVCLKSAPRIFGERKLLNVDKSHKFVVKCKDKTEEEIFFLNGKEISRRHYSNPWGFYKK